MCVSTQTHRFIHAVESCQLYHKLQKKAMQFTKLFEFPYGQHVTVYSLRICMPKKEQEKVKDFYHSS